MLKQPAETAHQTTEETGLALPSRVERPDGIPPVAFPVALRGYDRQTVDDYVAQLLRRIADLEAERSPQAAVRRALDRVGEETAGILRRAHEAADELTARTRAQADSRLEQARGEAEEMRSAAEARVRELDADADLIWQERCRLIDDTRALAEALLNVADEANERFAAQEEGAEGQSPSSADMLGDVDGGGPGLGEASPEGEPGESGETAEASDARADHTPPVESPEDGAEQGAEGAPATDSQATATHDVVGDGDRGADAQPPDVARPLAGSGQPAQDTVAFDPLDAPEQRAASPGAYAAGLGPHANSPF